MSIIEYKTPEHWNYFLALEQDIITISRYIEFTKNNYSTYSIELSKILFIASSEVDVIAKQLCKKIKKDSKAKNIAHYRATITSNYPIFSSTTVEIPRYGLKLSPWVNWSNNKKPDWWDAYNKVKHERDKYFHEANLKNTLNSISGLFIMLLFLYKDLAIKGQLGPNPNIFRPGIQIKADYPAWEGNSFMYFIDERT